jgi:hypothetical protein
MVRQYVGCHLLVLDEVSMRNRLIAGLFTTAVLFFAAPVAAEEYFPQHRSLTVDIEEIQDMVKRSQERQGYVHNTQEVESEPVAPISGQSVVEPDPVIEPISEPISTPDPVSIKPIHPESVVRFNPVTIPNTQSRIATEPKVKVLPESTTVFQEVKPNTVFTPNSVFTPNNPATTPAPANVTPYIEEPQTPLQSKVVPHRAQKIAVRHANRHRHQSASDELPSKSNAMNQEEPTREKQLNHKGFMLFAADLAWERVDTKHDYALGARLERGVISPLSAIRVYAPDKLPEALAILAGQKEYT